MYHVIIDCAALSHLWNNGTATRMALKAHLMKQSAAQCPLHLDGRMKSRRTKPDPSLPVSHRWSPYAVAGAVYTQKVLSCACGCCHHLICALPAPHRPNVTGDFHTPPARTAIGILGHTCAFSQSAGLKISSLVELHAYTM